MKATPSPYVVYKSDPLKLWVVGNVTPLGHFDPAQYALTRWGARRIASRLNKAEAARTPTQ